MDGISIINTTDTSVELTSSLVNVSCAITVCITASLQQYVSEKKQEVIDSTGSKRSVLVLITLDINRLFYKHSECYCVI